MKTNFSQDTTQTKLILLFVFEKMEIALTENSIIDICTGEQRWMNYMDCKDALWKLVNSGLIYQPSKDTKDSCYAITNEGRNCLSHFYNRIPMSTREAITEYARENRSAYKRMQEYTSNYSRDRDGFYVVTLKIKESAESQPVLELKIKVPTRENAISLSKKWCEKAAPFYEYAFENLVLGSVTDADKLGDND